MDYVKEIIEFFSKAKNVRLNIAICLASTLTLIAVKKNWISITETWYPALEFITFITLIRIMSSGLSKFHSHYEERKISLRKSNSEIESMRLSKAIEDEKVQKMRIDFSRLDIYQLQIIQELKKANTTRVRKGAPLFTLKKFGIVEAAAAGPNTETVQLSARASQVLEDDIWRQLEQLKYFAAVRFFRGIEGSEARAFDQFIERDSIYTRTTRSGRSVDTWEGTLFSKHANSTLFTQPQVGYSYDIDASSKKALLDTRAAP